MQNRWCAASFHCCCLYSAHHTLDCKLLLSPWAVLVSLDVVCRGMSLAMRREQLGGTSPPGDFGRACLGLGAALFLCVGLVPGRVCCVGPDGVRASATGGARKLRRSSCVCGSYCCRSPSCSARGSSQPPTTVFSVASTPATHSHRCVFAAWWSAAMLLLTCAGVEGSEHPAGCCMGCAVH